MVKNYDGWALKDTRNRIRPDTFTIKKSDLEERWIVLGHEIVKVKLVEVSDGKTE